jgi:mRNA interferase MazF
MRRGDVVTVADRDGQFTGRPRPAVIVQGDAFAELASVTICPITSADADAPLLRLELLPGGALSLHHASWIEVDKITTVRRNRIGEALGRVSDTDLVRLNGVLAVLLGIG